MYRKNCFAFKRNKDGHSICSALKLIDCQDCKFFKTKEDYKKYVEPLKNKKEG